MNVYKQMSNYALEREYLMVRDYVQLHKDGVKLAQRENHQKLAFHHAKELVKKEAHLEEIKQEISIRAGSVSQSPNQSPTTTKTNKQKS